MIGSRPVHFVFPLCVCGADGCGSGVRRTWSSGFGRAGVRFAWHVMQNAMLLADPSPAFPDMPPSAADGRSGS